MPEPLNILIVDDCEDDVLLLIRMLQRAGFEPVWQRAQTEADFKTALGARLDLIFFDSHIPGFSERRGLELLQERRLEIPFIIISNNSAESVGLEVLLSGAIDVVFKDRLATIGIAVHRALREFRSRAERRQLEARLRQAQKMEVIGRVASSVAHDFNNILMTIMVDADLSSNEVTVPPLAQEAFRSIKLSAQRAACLTRQLLRFGKRKEAETGRIDVNEKVASLAEMLERIVGEGVELRINVSSRPLLTQADSDRIDQVLLNLVVNARDAVSGNGQIMIETLQRSISENETGTVPNASPGEYVCIRVADNGCGIAPENLARIFEPFFTTKEHETGTGLGLATVLEVVQEHKGFIKVCSTIGRGTTFEVLLPACEAARPNVSEVPRPPSIRGGTETILLVEDDADVRRITRTVLERYGYKVLDARDARTALDEWVQHKRRVDLLLTDIVLPGGMSGADLAAQLRHCEPRLEVIFMSGYNAEAAIPGHELQPGQRFLQKPCSINELLLTVRGSLDEVGLARKLEVMSRPRVIEREG